MRLLFFHEEAFAHSFLFLTDFPLTQEGLTVAGQTGETGVPALWLAGAALRWDSVRVQTRHHQMEEATVLEIRWNYKDVTWTHAVCLTTILHIMLQKYKTAAGLLSSRKQGDRWKTLATTFTIPFTHFPNFSKQMGQSEHGLLVSCYFIQKE